MQSRANRIGLAVALLAWYHRRGHVGWKPGLDVQVSSIVTVDMSTRMPIARAMPPRDMMLIVLPVRYSPNREPSSARGMLGDDDDHVFRTSLEEQEDHQPGEHGPDYPLGAA